MLHDVIEDTNITEQDIQQEFGNVVAHIVSGVTKVTEISDPIEHNRPALRQKDLTEIETLRKLLFATIKDVRVMLIKFADKLHNMMTLTFKSPEKQKYIAEECLTIYAPIAERLGVSWMRTNFEDLSFKYLLPEKYYEICNMVNETQDEREQILHEIENQIYTLTKERGIRLYIHKRAKHFYSIYKKLLKKDAHIHQIHDMLALRIICYITMDCYIILGMIHQHWNVVSERYKDYIAKPKSNGYQSLHTIIIHNNKHVEIQIRTDIMDITANFGIAAHWQYKTNIENKKNSTLRKITEKQEELLQNNIKEDQKTKQPFMIDQLKELYNNQYLSIEYFWETMQHEVLSDSIIIYTPKGEIKELPIGSTAIDFAYNIHSELGNHICYAKANGRIIPLHQALENGQTIEIGTNNNAHPSVNWLNYVCTAKARSKIRHWCRKNGILPSTDGMHTHNLKHRDNIITNQHKTHNNHVLIKYYESADIPTTKNTNNFSIRQLNNVLLKYAPCCNPIPGMPIIGYISHSRGIIIHHRDCYNVKNIPDIKDRILPLEWDDQYI